RSDPTSVRPADIEADETKRFMRSIDEELILQAGVETSKAGCARQVFGLQMRPALADREAEIRCDALREIDVDSDLLRAVQAGRRPRERRQGDFVGDEGIVGQVAGKNRWPAKPWAAASCALASAVIASATQAAPAANRKEIMVNARNLGRGGRTRL